MSEDELERAARAFVSEVEAPAHDNPCARMLAVVATLLGAGANATALANAPGRILDAHERPSVNAARWATGPLPDEFRQTLYAVYSDEYGREDQVKRASVSREVADLYADIAPLVRALDKGIDRELVLRTLASEVDGNWGQTAAMLVRPLWELANW